MQTIGLEVEAVPDLVTPDITPILKTPEEIITTENQIQQPPEIQSELPSTSAGEKENQQPGVSAITNNTQP